MPPATRSSRTSMSRPTLARPARPFSAPACPIILRFHGGAGMHAGYLPASPIPTAVCVSPTAWPRFSSKTPARHARACRELTMKSPLFLLLACCLGSSPPLCAPTIATSTFAAPTPAVAPSRRVPRPAAPRKWSSKPAQAPQARSLHDHRLALSNGNVVPLLGRLRWDGRRVHASCFLLGMQA